MKEQDYKKYIYNKADRVETKEDLDNLLNEVIKSKDLTYGTIVYAISGCMKAVARYIDRSEAGGITGFQASFIGWEMVKDFMVSNNKTGMKLINYDELLYPQYRYKFKKEISETLWKMLQQEAKKLLKTAPDAHPRVIKHWQSIVDGKVPFGFKVVGAKNA